MLSIAREKEKDEQRTRMPARGHLLSGAQWKCIDTVDSTLTYCHWLVSFSLKERKTTKKNKI